MDPPSVHFFFRSPASGGAGAGTGPAVRAPGEAITRLVKAHSP